MKTSCLFICIVILFSQALGHCTDEEIKKLQGCFKAYASTLGTTDENLLKEITIFPTELNSTKCDDVNELNSCLGAEIVKKCINRKVFTKENGFDHSEPGPVEGARWISYYLSVTHFCGLTHELRSGLSQCAAQNEQALLDCGLPTSCDNLEEKKECMIAKFGEQCPTQSAVFQKALQINLCPIFCTCEWCNEIFLYLKVNGELVHFRTLGQ